MTNFKFACETHCLSQTGNFGVYTMVWRGGGGGSRNPLSPVRLSSGNQKGIIFKMASKMAAVALESQ